MVDIEPVLRFPEIVALPELRADPRLEGMPLLARFKFDFPCNPWRTPISITSVDWVVWILRRSMDVWDHDPCGSTCGGHPILRIRDVVVPATALEAEGHEILKFNIGDPLAYSWSADARSYDSSVCNGAREPGQRIRSVLRDSRAESGHRRIRTRQNEWWMVVPS